MRSLFRHSVPDVASTHYSRPIATPLNATQQQRSLNRRQFLWTLGAASTVLATGWLGRSAPAWAGTTFEFQLSDAQWRDRLSAAQYAVLRQEGTERPYTSQLNKEKRAGTFHCAGCGLALFSSAAKFESGTGWPSFWQPVADAVGTHEDNSYGMRRTEVHCRRCGGHLGHVFNDGPRPTGLRYCMNGVALQFAAQAA